MKVYFISGMGANERAFQYLDLSFCEPIFIRWITPQHNESLPHYALRLKELITEPRPIIVGVSFGGMLLTEMAKADPAVQGIIISSYETSREIPRYLRMWKYLPVYKWVPPAVIRAVGSLTPLVFGRNSPLVRQTMSKIVQQSDPVFTAWAINAILTWENNQRPSNVIHIHGTADNLLPYPRIQPHYTIERGTHLMIIDKAAELSSILKKIVGEMQ